MEKTARKNKKVEGEYKKLELHNEMKVRERKIDLRESILEGLNSYEISTLFLTNEDFLRIPKPKKIVKDAFGRTYEEPIILTTKHAYIWGTLIANLYSKIEFYETDVDSAIKKGVNSFCEHYRNIIQGQPEDYFIPHHFPKIIGEAHYSLFMDFIKYFKIEEDHEFLMYSSKITSTTVNSLIKKRIIEDPFELIIGGWPVIVLGFIPYSFTKKTEKGQVIERKIGALFWEYEKKKGNHSPLGSPHLTTRHSGGWIELRPDHFDKSLSSLLCCFVGA